VSKKLSPHRSFRAAVGRGCTRLRRSVSPTVRKGLTSLLDQALVNGGNFFVAVCLGRFGSRAELGVFALAVSLAYFARGLQQQMLSAPYMVYCQAKRGRTAARYAGSSFAHQAIFTAATTLALAALLAAALWAAPAFASILAVLLFAAPFVLLREQIRNWSFAHLEMKASLYLDAAVTAVQVGGTVLLARYGWLNAHTALAVLGVACAAASVGWMFLRRPHLALRAKLARFHWLQNWSFAKWTFASHMLGGSTPYIMPWIVVFLSGEAATGMLAACNSLVGLSNTFLIGLSNYLSPRTARVYAQGGVESMARVLRENALLFSVVLGAFSVAMAVVGESLTQLVYGASFAGAGSVVFVLALSMWAVSLNMTAGNGLWAMNRPAANFRADVCTMVVSVAVSLFLTAAWGAFGAALGILAGSLAGGAVRCYALLAWMDKEKIPRPLCPETAKSPA